MIAVMFIFMILLPVMVFSITIEDITLIPKFEIDDQGYSGNLCFNPVDGTIHAVWVRGNFMRYRVRTPDGVWQPIEEISTGTLRPGSHENGNPRNAIGLFIDDDGISHIVFNEQGGSVFYFKGTPGNWETPVLIAPKGNNTSYAQIKIIKNYKIVTFLDLDEKELYYLECWDGVWGPVTYMYDADNPNLALGENGMVYSLAREFIWKNEERYNGIFAYKIPGFTDWSYVKYVTDADRRCGKEVSLAVGAGKIYAGWNNSTGIGGDFKGEVFCAAANEPGVYWNKRLGGKEMFYEATGDPYATTSVYSDGTPLLINGKTKFNRYVVWNGKYWSAQGKGDWADGLPRFINDGKTAWMILSSTRYETLPVTAHGFINTLIPEGYDFSNRKPVIQSVPDTLAAVGYPWSTVCQATDADGDPVSYAPTWIPAGMTVDSTSGLIRWTPSETGTYIIGVKAVDSERGFDAQYFRLHVVDNATLAQFSADVLSGEPPLQVQFTDESVGEIQSWTWDFGDGTSSTQQHPSHTYQNAGFYTVKLIASGLVQSDTLVRTQYIHTFYHPPVAAFTASPDTGIAPLSVQFTDASSGRIDTWAWAFGDGVTSAQQNPSHVYSDPGTYTAVLNISGPGGQSASECPVHVLAAPPVARFGASPRSGYRPLTVQFTDSSTGTVSSYMWDFGDGQTSNEASPAHVYENEGVYTVRVSLTGPGGEDDLEKTNYIFVGDVEPPVALFTADPLDGLAPLTVSFTNQSTGSIIGYQWYFGDVQLPDGGLSGEENPTHTYQEAGTYSVLLTVIGPDTSVDELKHNLIQVSATRVQSESAPEAFSLYPNHPNPFNMQTQIRYDLPNSSDVDFVIYDALGKMVFEWHPSAQAPGRYQFVWNGLDYSGQPVPSGIYILHFHASEFHDRLKLMLIK